MATLFQIPKILRPYAGGVKELRLTGTTVRALLDELKRDYPALYQCICNETGAIRQHINLFINNDFLKDRDGLETKIESGDVVSVFQAVSGG